MDRKHACTDTTGFGEGTGDLMGVDSVDGVCICMAKFLGGGHRVDAAGDQNIGHTPICKKTQKGKPPSPRKTEVGGSTTQFLSRRRNFGGFICGTDIARNFSLIGDAKRFQG